MRMLYHIKQQVFPKASHFLGKRKTGFFPFIKMGEAVSMLKVCYQFHIETGWLTILNKLAVAQCAVQTNQARQQRFSPVAVNQFLIFFSVRFECSHTLSRLEMLFILRSSLNLI